MTHPKDTEFLDDFISSLKNTKGVVAIVLGGSRSKGTHHPGSDFDLGLYYDSKSPPDIGDLCQVASSYDDRREAGLLTSFGEWGPWINGGGWLKVKSMQVDLIYRDLSTVRTVFEDCQNGQVSISYQPGHPHGFISSIYFAEIAHCKILSDERGLSPNLSPKPPRFR